MLVRVRLFAALRERAGRDELELELPEGARVRDALESVADVAGGLRVVMAVNREYADEDAPLRAGDELALIPPVSGGATAERRATGDADAAGRAETQPHVDVVADAALPRRARRSRPRPARGRGGHVPGRHARGRAAGVRGLRRDGARAPGGDRRRRRSSVTGCARRRPSTASAPCRWASPPSRSPRARRTAARRSPVRGTIIDAIKAQAPIWKKEVSGESAAWVPGKPPPTP